MLRKKAKACAKLLKLRNRLPMLGSKWVLNDVFHVMLSESFIDVLLLSPGGRAGDAVEACRRFYLDACLHGIQSAKDPTVAEKKACVDAITAGSCDVVREPQRAPACAFIVPPDTPADAGADTSATDAKEPAPPVAQPDAAK